jgi:hypothetical protein
MTIIIVYSMRVFFGQFMRMYDSSQHRAETERVHAQFLAFLRDRRADQHVSINRSKGGHGDSNRTVDAAYKRRGLTVDVSGARSNVP